VDPLDAYMAGGILEEAEAAAAEAEAKDAKDRETIAAGEEIDEGDRKMTYEQSREAQEAASWHCYICKKYGHTKRDCPDRKWDPTRVSKRQAEDLGLETVCKHCLESGHEIRDCPKKKADDKVVKRKKQYAQKKMIRAAERLAIKAQVERDNHIAGNTQKEKFDREMNEYGGKQAAVEAAEVDAPPKKKSRWGTTAEGDLYFKKADELSEEEPAEAEAEPELEPEAEVEVEAAPLTAEEVAAEELRAKEVEAKEKAAIKKEMEKEKMAAAAERMKQKRAPAPEID